MSATYIVAARRSPIGKFGGAFVNLSPVDLAGQVMAATLAQSAAPADALDLVIFGNILKHGHGQLLTRQAALRAGIPEQVDGYGVDMLCSSGMLAVMNAGQAIRAGEADLVLAGGVESMSQAGFLVSHKARWGMKLLTGSDNHLSDLLVDDGLRDPTTQELMGEETDRLAKEYKVTRAELDAVAAASHQRASAASAGGYFAAEIAPITVPDRGRSGTVSQDEGIRPDSTPDSLARLRPAFADGGLLTAGNSSQLSDGAAALLLASETAVARHGLTPLARILGGATAGVTPWRFVEGPIPAVEKLLQKTGLAIRDFDLFENNEAFALNTILLRRALAIADDRLNIHGGAIALGHPIGASGARIIVTLIHALRSKGGRRGLASLCHGLGGGTALAVELV